MPLDRAVSRRHFLRTAGAAGLGVAVSTSPLLAACGGGDDGAGDGGGDELKVGVVAPFTGLGTSIGEVVNNALTAAVQQVNSTGGVEGRKVRVLLRDTASDPGNAARIYAELAGQPDVVGLLWCGAPGFAEVLPQVRRDGIPVIAVFEDPYSAGALHPEGDEAGRSVFQASVPDVLVKEVLADYAANDRGYTSAALMHSPAVPPQGDSRGHLEQAFGKAGVKVAGVETFSTGDQDFTAQLGRLRAARPQVLFLDGLSDETGAIATALDGMGAAYVDTPTAKGPEWHPHVFGSFRAVNYIWADVAQEAAKVGSVTAWHLGGLPFLPTFAVGGWMRRFVGKDARGGEEACADGLYTLVRGVQKAGSGDRRRVVEGIETMGPLRFASLEFGYEAGRHHAVTKDDVAVLTLERLRGPAPTDPSYELGQEWKELDGLGRKAAAATLLVRPTMAANRRAHPDVMADVLRRGYGTQCTKHGDGSLGKECKIH